VKQAPESLAIPTKDAAYAVCARIAKLHYENFPVASRLLPAGMRPHVAAVYAFARVADDFADEGDRLSDERLRLLDGWEKALHAVAEGGAPPRPSGGSVVGDADAGAVFVALGETIRARRLPVPLLVDLLSAFRQDVTVNRYGTWDSVLDYCRRSANPVGRLVLRIAGYNDAKLDEASDALCTALQLANFWQDLGRDWQKDRLYVPLERLERQGARIGLLNDGQLDTAWARVLADLCAETRAFFERGRAVCDGVRGRLRLELRLTWLGGVTILDRVERAQASIIAQRPTLGARDVPGLLWRASRWRF